DVWRAHPDTAPTILADLRQYFFGTDREALRAQSALASARTTKAPVFVVHAAENSYVPVTMGRELYRALKNGSEETAYLELPGEGHGGWSEKTTARLFAELGRFFNSTIYNYGVDVGAPEVVR
ncbi:MAG: alpha/beta hydrolase family protein, partial [Opitutaceae bacterium]